MRKLKTSKLGFIAPRLPQKQSFNKRQGFKDAKTKSRLGFLSLNSPTNQTKTVFQSDKK